MAYEMREGSGSLFQADQKGNEKAPKYRGDIMLNGVTYELAGWVKKTQKGDNFLSLSGKVKEYKSEMPQVRNAHTDLNAMRKDGVADMDSDIPF